MQVRPLWHWQSAGRELVSSNDPRRVGGGAGSIVTDLVPSTGTSVDVRSVSSIRPVVSQHFLPGVPPEIPKTRLGRQIFVMCPSHGQVQSERLPRVFRQVAADADPSVESAPPESEFQPARPHRRFAVQSLVDGRRKVRPPWSPHRTPVPPTLYPFGPGRRRSPVCNPGIHGGLRHPTHASSRPPAEERGIGCLARA